MYMENRIKNLLTADARYLFRKEIFTAAALLLFIFLYALYNIDLLKVQSSNLFDAVVSNRYVFIILYQGSFLASTYSFLFKPKVKRKELFIRIDNRIFVRCTFLYILIRSVLYALFITLSAIVLITTLSKGSFTSHSLLKVSESFILFAMINIFTGLLLLLSEMLRYGAFIKVFIILMAVFNIFCNLYTIPALNILSMTYYLYPDNSYNLIQISIKLLSISFLTFLIICWEKNYAFSKSA